MGKRRGAGVGAEELDGSEGGVSGGFRGNLAHPQHRECGPSGVNADDLRRVMGGWAKEPRNTHVKTMSKGTMKVQYMTAVRDIMSIKVLIFESTRMNKPLDC
jgi:hypothetical protein